MKWYDVAGWLVVVASVVFFIMFTIAAVWTSTMAGGKEVDDGKDEGKDND